MSDKLKTLSGGGRKLGLVRSESQSALSLFRNEWYQYKTETKSAYTLAEVLITLVVIGVIAAITIPAVVQNTNNREYAAAMQKARATIGEAFRLMSIHDETDKNTTTENYTKYVLSRYLKIIKTCNNASDCDFPEEVKRPDGSILSPIPTTMKSMTSANSVTIPRYVNSEYSTFSSTNDTTNNYNNAYFFVTLDGFHVMFFYNPYCVFDFKERPYFWDSLSETSDIVRQLSHDVACHWGVYDMNGTKGPNQVGKDIGFVGSFYNGANTKAASVLPNPSAEVEVSSTEVQSAGGVNNWEKSNNYCNKLDNGNYRLPDVNELSLMYLNRKFVTDSNDKYFWSASPVLGLNPSYMYTVYFHNGFRNWNTRTTSHSYSHVICVRKDTGK